jgi:molecular chaperone GrpE
MNEQKAKGKKQKVAEMEQRVGELTHDLQRVQAEFINFKKRSEDEKSQITSFAKSQVIKDLLPVIDDLERALAHQPKELETNKWAQGVKKIHERLEKQLEKLGITKIDALNKTFDPVLHEAVQVEGNGESQIVSEILQNGYQLSGQVIRHAIVKVEAR